MSQYMDGDSDDGGGWRDASILVDDNSNSGFHQNQRGSADYPSVEDAPDRQPDDCWMLPSNSSVMEVLGPNCVRLDDIRKKTEAYMTFNSGKYQVDIWGDRSCIDEAKKYLDVIGNKVNERKHPMRSTKKWEKPARELTEKEKRRVEKRQQRKTEEKRYQGLPAVPQPFTASFTMPDSNIPLPKIIGEKEAYLNQIRASCKSFIWYDEGLHIFKVAGQDNELVEQAAGRVRNLYLKIRRGTDPTMPRSSELRLLYQPTRNIGARFIKLPKNFVSCDLYSDEQISSYRILEPIAGGKPSASLVQYNMLTDGVKKLDLSTMQQQQQKQQQQSVSLIDFGDNNDDDNAIHPGQNLDTSEIAESLRDLNIRNAKMMERALDEGLESLRLLDWEISMEVAFGQIYLLNYPKRDDFYTFSSEQLANLYFPHHVFNSKLAPCIGTTYNHVKGLLEYLSVCGEEYTDSPRTSYVIEAIQNPTLPEPARPESKYSHRGGGPSRGEQAAAAAAAEAASAVTWKSVLTVNTFTKEGHAGLWNCVTDSNTLVNISCANLEGEYSWETRLNYARRLPSDYDTPQGQFVNYLRRSKDNRLVMSVTPAYRPHIIKQRTKWVYAWKRYIIEVEKEEMWDMSNMDDTHHTIINSNDHNNHHSTAAAAGLPTDLSSFTPHRVNYYVTMARENWRYRFAENIDLAIGEAPTWTIRDFLANNVDEENTAMLQKDAKEFADIMTKVLPVFYETRPASLV
ncbi:hypothetical protein BCR42DRAFT_412365 [Absidia repens]|uniref:DUF7905 domain-containing protein n=1 Tax=Absidia repens TaxID=90262 RepID=A0A1X2IJM9_9FUNG|nr:hypothetical protein BCR42DRAFT_412365 [Absidia repens]